MFVGKACISCLPTDFSLKLLNALVPTLAANFDYYYINNQSVRKEDTIIFIAGNNSNNFLPFLRLKKPTNQNC